MLTFPQGKYLEAKRANYRSIQEARFERTSQSKNVSESKSVPSENHSHQMLRNCHAITNILPNADSNN